MNKKPKLVYGIKGKLVSAACMLLVAVIMVVSSTYAWFTLSTAPEVTGIQTAVGANGSLEMALLPSSGNAGDVTSSVGDSKLANTLKNVTWGNIVDLSDPSYGLDKITLYPSRLNKDGSRFGSSLLSTPVYGADGRVFEVKANTVTGIYDATKGGFPVSEEGYGVRAVGVASGMTQRQLDYRNATQSASNYASKAKTAAMVSLNTYGSTLANIVVKKAMETSPTYTQADIDALNGLINSLQAAGGPLDNIEKAYMQYVLGYAASKAVQDTADAGKEETLTVWKAVQSLVNADGATLSSVLAGLGTVELPGTLDAAIDALNATKAAVSTAAGKMPSGKTSYAWSDISEAVSYLADVDNITVNGYAATEVKDNMSGIINSVAGSGINVAMASGAGVYADIADHCGNYSASITIAKLSAGGLTMENVNAKMHANGISTAYLTACGTALTAAGSPAGDGAVMPISEFYGYVIDLAFRTNAVESYLLLQTAPKDRIYDGNNNAETMGHGSSMTFATVSTDFTNDQVKELMSAIRVVFFDPNTSDIIAYAKLDTTNASVGADGVTANLYLYTLETTTTHTAVIEGATVSVYEKEGAYYTDEDCTIPVEAGTEVTTVTTETEGALITERADAKIMALQQNVATALSALVYLNGDIIGNDKVAATAAQSMIGTMNLQFSSSANLVPMEYADLHQPGTTPETPETPTP